MLIALPNEDGSFTCTLFLPFEGPVSFATLDSPGKLTAFFEEQFPDALSLIPDLSHDFFKNPTGSMVTVKSTPWQVGGRSAVLGDAAHAIVPFFGQGMNCAFEDCLCLAECLKKHPADQARALAEYEDLRKENADAIADMALTNFIEMRDKVASRWFRYKKKIDHALHAIFPEAMTPLYNMVSFSTIPYADAKRRDERRARILRNIGWWTATIALAIVLGVVISMSRRS